jgi:hypothetical protein
MTDTKLVCLWLALNVNLNAEIGAAASNHFVTAAGGGGGQEFLLIIC